MSRCKWQDGACLTKILERALEAEKTACEKSLRKKEVGEGKGQPRLKPGNVETAVGEGVQRVRGHGGLGQMCLRWPLQEL